MFRWAVIRWTTDWRYRWSRIRHFRSPRVSSIRTDLVPQNLDEVKLVAAEINRNFVYRRDGFSRLFDSIDTPAGCWERTFKTGPLKDDCDGFHAALYWAVSRKMHCFLFTIAALNITHSHTLLCIEANNYYYIADYTYISKGFLCKEDVIKDICARRSIGSILVTESSVWNGARWQSLPASAAARFDCKSRK